MDLPFDRSDDHIGDTGIPVHETMFMLDSSKLQQLMDCPRGFFFNYILGWQNTDPNIHLVFGSAWHEAMEHVMEHGTSKQALLDAHAKFKEVYEEEFASDPMASEHYSKNPENALKALADYAAEWPIDPTNTVYTEIAGATPIREDRQIHFKMDAIRRHPEHHEEAGKYYAMEHKTTSRKTQSWQDKWGYKFQVGTYLHALNSWLSDPKDLDGLTINGSIFRKNDTEHLRIPIRKSGAQMMEYLFEANYWWSFYERNMRLLANEVDPSDQVMVAFPRNTESCSKFGCKFKGLCNTRPNPCRDLRTPVGYERDFWDPRRKKDDAKWEYDPDTGKIEKVEEGTEDDSENEGEQESNITDLLE